MRELSERGDRGRLNNPMRFSLGNREIDIGRFPVEYETLEMRVSDGQVYLHWDDGRPEVVCLCGSTRFKDEFLEEQERLTLEGKIFLTVGFFGHVDGWPDGAGHESETKEALDDLHKRKIDVADRVLVVNPGGYVGSSTRSEIAYARGSLTPVDWLERPPGANAGGCWICETGNGHEDPDMPLDTEFDTYYHPECLEAAGADSVLDFETRGGAGDGS